MYRNTHFIKISYKIINIKLYNYKIYHIFLGNLKIRLYICIMEQKDFLYKLISQLNQIDNYKLTGRNSTGNFELEIREYHIDVEHIISGRLVFNPKQGKPQIILTSRYILGYSEVTTEEYKEVARTHFYYRFNQELLLSLIFNKDTTLTTSVGQIINQYSIGNLILNGTK